MAQSAETLKPELDTFEPPKDFKELLQKRKTRVQLATLTTDRSKNGGYDKANAFIATLDGVTDWNDAASRTKLLASLNAFLQVGIDAKYTSLSDVKKQLSAKDITPVKFRVMVMEVRATMMTDSSQALGLNASK